MATYLVKQQIDGVFRHVAHPGYLDDNGELANPELLRPHGFYLATDEVPTIDTRYQATTRNSSDQWEFDHDTKTCNVTYTVETHPDAFDRYKSVVKARINNWVDQKTTEGVTVTTPDDGDQVIQTRHIVDNMNMLSVFSKASARVAANDDTPCHIRTEANVTLSLTPADAVNIFNTVFDAIEAIYQQGWGAKETLDGLVEDGDIVASLDALDAVYDAL